MGTQWSQTDLLRRPVRPAAAEPTRGSLLPYQSGIGLHPLGLVQVRLVLLCQLRGDGDGVERVDNNSPQAVFREVRHVRLLSFGNRERRSALQSAVSLFFGGERKRETERLPRPPGAMIAGRPLPCFTNFHEILTKKRAKVERRIKERCSQPSRASRRSAPGRSEKTVKVREVRKRSACYHCLKRAQVLRCARTRYYRHVRLFLPGVSGQDDQSYPQSFFLLRGGVLLCA